MTKDGQIRYRFFKVSINIFYYRIYNDTKVFAIKNNATLVFLAIWYSLISLLFGWWGWSIIRPFRTITNTLEAIHINLTGGMDYTEKMNETEFDDKTNYIWNNLLRKTIERINKKEVEIIIEIQEEFEQLDKEKYTEENIDFIIMNLGKIDIHRETREEIRDIFEAIQSYERNVNE
jgi:hypothetical protein